MNNTFLLFIVVIAIALISCEREIEKDKEVVAIVHNNKLYLDDIIINIPKNLSEEDSIRFTKLFINQWVSDQLFFYEASRRLKDSFEIEQKVEKYRRDLYIHQYKRDNIVSNINYNVSQDEIKKYYKNNLKEFTLNQSYVKAHYLTMTAMASSYYLERNVVMNTEMGDHQKLIDFTTGTGRRVYFEDDWIELNEFLRKINYQGDFDFSRLRFENHIDNVDDNLRYLVKINEYVLQGDYAPIELVKNRIIEIIINKRKKEALDRKRNELLTNALQDGSVVMRDNILEIN